MALIPSKSIDLLNYRIQQEEQSSRIYKAMSVWLDLHGFSGASKLWKKYSDEELPHAEWARQYLLDLNILPVTPSQEEPRLEFSSLQQIVAISMEHELKITMQCEDLARVCLSSSDMKTFLLAQKYVNEQVEEIAKIQYWIDKIETFGTSEVAMRLLDEEMGE